MVPGCRNFKYSAFSPYFKIARQYPRLSRKEERFLIRRAWHGDVASKKKFVLHFTGFFLFRVLTTVYGHKLVELGEDMIHDCHVLADERIKYYKLWYKNKDGIYVSYAFSTYLWKYVTGIIMKRIKDSYKTVSYDDELMVEEDEHFPS